MNEIASLKFEDKTVAVIGDVIVDRYTYGTVLGVSAETPTLVARRLEEKTTLGGAFFLCRNLLALGARVKFISVIGDDDGGMIAQNYRHPRLESHLLREPGRSTTMKHRFWVDRYKLFQLDTVNNIAITGPTAAKVRQLLDDSSAKIDAVVFSDYRHGLLQRDLIAKCISVARQIGVPTYVDSQISQSESNHHLYAGCSVLCLNLKEARAIDSSFDPARGDAAFEAIMRKINCESVVVKLGKDGSIWRTSGKTSIAEPLRVEEVDSTGAGDAFLAALALCGRDDPEVSLRVANAWGALSVTIHGTEPPTLARLVEVLRSRHEGRNQDDVRTDS